MNDNDSHLTTQRSYVDYFDDLDETESADTNRIKRAHLKAIK